MKKIIVVGCGGLGIEIAKEHLASGDQVIGMGVDPVDIKENNFNYLSLDVSSTEEVKRVFAENASLIDKTDKVYYTVAAMQTEDNDCIDKFDAEYALKIYNINTLGALRVVKEIKKYLNDNAKICLVSSKNGSMSETIQFMRYGAEQKFAYNLSKAALNMGAVILHEKLKEEGIKVIVVHPGSMKTRMSGYQGKNDPVISAKGIIEVLENSEENQFYSFKGERIEW